MALQNSERPTYEGHSVLALTGGATRAKMLRIFAA